MAVRMISDDLAMIRLALAGQERASRILGKRLLCVQHFVPYQARKLGVDLPADEVDDLAQSVLILAWERLGEFKGWSKLETWLFRFCQFELRNHLRRREDRPKSLGHAQELVDEKPRSSEGPSRNPLQNYLKHLSPREAEVVRLRHVDGLNLREIEERLGLSLSTVKTCYYRGRDKLREIIRIDRVGEAS